MDFRIAEDWEWSMNALQANLDANNPFGKILLGDRPVLVARTPEQRGRGMIGRRFQGYDGMLFVYDSMQAARFRNVGVEMDLNVAFYDEHGRRLGLTNMAAGEATPVESPVCQYVLETAAADYELDVWPPLALDYVRALTAQEMKRSAESVNLRPAAINAPERCANCTFYLGGGSCEIVERAGNDLVCDEFTLEDDKADMYPEMTS